MSSKPSQRFATGCALMALVACGSSGGGSSIATPIVAATPTLTVPTYASVSGTAVVSTQAQTGCTYTWSVGGDAKAAIASGQSTDTIAISGFSAAPETIQVSVTVQGAAGTASASASSSFKVAAPPATATIKQSIPVVAPGDIVTLTLPSTGTGLVYAWTVTDATILSGGTTTQVQITAGTPGLMDAICNVTDPVTSLVTTDAQNIQVIDPSVAAPTTPVITGPATFTPGATGLVYAITPQSGCTYAWSVWGNYTTGGTVTDASAITAGQGTASVTLTAPAVSTNGLVSMGVEVKVSNAGGQAQDTLVPTVLP